MYYDEEIILRRQLKRRDVLGNLEEGLYIRGELCRFQRKKVLLGAFRIAMPESFIRMPEELSGERYLLSSRPEEIYMSRDTMANLAFSRLGRDAGGDAALAMAAVRELLLKWNGGYELLFERSGEALPGGGALLALRSPGLEEDCFHLGALLSAGGRLLHASFNCPYREREEWERAVLMIFESLEGGEICGNET